MQCDSGFVDPCAGKCGPEVRMSQSCNRCVCHRCRPRSTGKCSYKQDIAEGHEACLVRVCDILTFGALKPFPKYSGLNVLQMPAYICESDLTEWVKCLIAEAKPTGVPANILDEIKRQ
ncbi:hypothetical protein quinque_004884 [Culex quinquefasciatus]